MLNQRATDLHGLGVGGQAVEEETDDPQVPAVKHQLFWGELQRRVGGHQLGPGRANWN